MSYKNWNKHGSHVTLKKENDASKKNISNKVMPPKKICKHYVFCKNNRIIKNVTETRS